MVHSWLYASVSTYKTHLLIKGFLDEESKNIWADMVSKAAIFMRYSISSLVSTSHDIHIYDGTGPIARLRRAEEALIEQTLQEMAVRACLAVEPFLAALDRWVDHVDLIDDMRAPGTWVRGPGGTWMHTMLS